MGKKRSEKCELEQPLSHRVPGVASVQQKQETSRRLRSRQKLVAQLRNDDDAAGKKEEKSRQQALATKLVEFPINFSLVAPGHFREETFHLCQTMVDRTGENLPDTEVALLVRKFKDKFGASYGSFVAELIKRIFIRGHLRCLQEDAGLSDEEMAKMHPLQLLRLLDGVNNTHVPTAERRMKVLAADFGLASRDIITELVEKMFEAFAKVAPDEAMAAFAKAAHDESVKKATKEVHRQRMLAKKLVKIPLNFSPVHPDQITEMKRLYQKMIDSAKENVPKAVLRLLEGKLMDKFGRSYKTFVWHLCDHIWLQVHMRCLQEDAAGLVGFSDEEIAKMHPPHLLMIWDGVNSTHTPSGERKMKVLMSEFGLGSYPKVEHIVTELVEKMVKAFALVAPDDALAVFAKVAHENAMDRAMALAVQGISLAQ